MSSKPHPGSTRQYRQGYSALEIISVGLASIALVLMITVPIMLPRITAPTGQGLPADQLGPVKHRSLVKGDGLPPKAPNPWFFVERAYPQGCIPREQWELAQIQARRKREEQLALEGALTMNANWVAAGPTNIGGRITDIAVDPADDNIVYAGAAEGGVLRTTDGGVTWTPLFDDQVTLSVGTLALDPTDPTIVYAGTGEVNPGGGSVAYGGAGVFRSTDRGLTWTALGLEKTGSIGRIRIDPTDPDRIYVAAMGDLWEKSPDRGVYRSTDGGTTWELVLYGSDSTGCVDLIMRPDTPEVLFAAMWERIRRPEYYRYGGWTCGVYKTADGGDTWSLVGGGLPTPSGDLGRIGLSLCMSQPDVIHAIYADRIGYFDGLYQSTDGGATWARTNDGALGSVFASYGWWFGNVRTHPENPQTIYVLGLDFWRSTNGGASYHDATGGMHVDHHGLDFGWGPNPVIYEGNDGGVYVSTNDGSVWSKLYELPVTQVYRVALDAGNGNALYGGTQDNGTVRTLTGSPNDWTMIFGGDGFQPLIHPLNSDHIWAQYQYGNLVFSDDGGFGWYWADGGIGSGDRSNWNSPLIQDPTDPDQRYFGTHRVYRSTDNTNWVAISPDLTGGPHLGKSGQVNGTLTTLAVSPLDGDVIWTGSDDGYVHVSSNGGTDWLDVSAGLPDRWITSVRTDPFNRETAYVSVSGFRWGEELPHVYRTVDLGASWTAIAGDLPEAPVNDFLADPADSDRYYVATDVGVYQTVDGGAAWHMVGSNLPNVVVTSLAFDSASRKLIAGTYGRSFFSYEVGDVSGVTGPPTGISAVIGRTFAPHPNPTGQGTWIAWELSKAAPVKVGIYTVAGRHVWSGTADSPQAGKGGIRWDGTDTRGRRLPAGTYFVRVTAGDRVIGRETIVLLR
jgi:photosystem II stability/assembly factor-like uncharacterized protein